MSYKKFFQITEWTSFTGKTGPRAIVSEIEGSYKGTIAELKARASDFEYYVEETTDINGNPDGFLVHFPDQMSMDDFLTMLKIIR